MATPVVADDVQMPPRWQEQDVPNFFKAVDATGDCWEWLQARNRGGYGVFGRWPRVKSTGAHRWAYTLLVGPIPLGLHLDHLCKNRGCVNPDHLEPVTQAENNRRGAAGAVNRARHTARTHCRRGGHPLSGENVYVAKSGSRHCKQCQRELRRARRARERQQAKEEK